VWQKLNDPAVLQRCIPGCESLEKTGDNAFKGTVALKLGPMALKFAGDVTLQDLNPPSSYKIVGSGKAGPAGFASGSADVKLAPNEGGTLLSYTVDSTIGGKMAQLGARLIDATAAQLAGQFFDKFVAEFPQPATAQAATGSVRADTVGGQTAIPVWTWVLIIAAVLLAIYLFYGHIGGVGK
jgi:carbon monoxide dehydrogenase subunit G